MLTDNEKSKLGEECECQRCGRLGEYMIEPYAREMFNEEHIVCLCEDCALDSRMSV